MVWVAARDLPGHVGLVVEPDPAGAPAERAGPTPAPHAPSGLALDPVLNERTP